MTTVWGMQASGQGNIPGRARLMTAAAAAGDRAWADDLWQPLDAGSQAAVLWWLSVRWRHLLLRSANDLAAPARGLRFLALSHALAGGCCDPVRDLALGALAGLDIELPIPECQPCARLAADTLCQAQLHFDDAPRWPRLRPPSVWRRLTF